MPVELLIAPPAAGKTHACIERIQELRKDKPLAHIRVIVPDRFQAAAFRSRLAAADGALGVQVGRFPDLLQDILERSGTFIPSAGRPLLHRLIQETVNEAVRHGQLPYFAPLQHFPGFIRVLNDSFAELKRALVTPGEFLEFARPGSPAQKDLAFLYAKYQAGLEKLHLADGEEITRLAVELLRGDPSAAGSVQLLVVDGFDSFNNAQVQALKLLSQQVAQVFITLPGQVPLERVAHRRFKAGFERLTGELHPHIVTLGNPPYLPEAVSYLEEHLFEAETADKMRPESPLLLEARSPAEEGREALRWIKKLVVRQGIPLAGCAIFTPNPGLYHPLLRVTADAFGIPIRFALDEPLELSPAMHALLQLLSLPVGNFKTRAFISVLRSPYFDFPIEAETVDTLERISRLAQVVQGQDQWQDALQRLIGSTGKDRQDLDDERNAPEVPRGPEAAALQTQLRDVFEKITPPHQAYSQTGWVTWLEDVLEGLQFYERADNERDLPACEVFREILRALVLSDAVLGRKDLDYASFLGLLQGVVQMDSYRETENYGQPAVWVGRMLEARGTRFEAVAILGLSEGSFPEVENPDPFLDEDLRKFLGMELRLQREQAGLFYQAVTRTDKHLLITRPYLSDSGEKWEESTYWKAAADLFEKESAVTRVNPEEHHPLTEAASLEELLFSAVRRKGLPAKYKFLLDRWQQLQHAQEVLKARRAKRIRGEHEGLMESLQQQINGRYPAGKAWSASRLETYASCPFQFYVGNALDLEARQPPSPGLDARQIGSILHEILEAAYKACPDLQDEEALLAALHQESHRIYDTAPEVFGFRPSALWEVEKAQLLEKLEQTVKVLSRDTAWLPVAFEAKFGIGGKSPLRVPVGDEIVEIRGVIDRVDRNASGDLRVIDYKTGGSHLGMKDLDKGYRLQLPIYAMAARDALGLGNPVDGLYWKILAAEAGSLKLANYKRGDQQGVQAAIEVVCEHLLRILNGIRSAEFPPRKPEGGCPSYCPAALWCWRYEPGR